MREWADFTVQEGGGRTTVVLQGPLVVSSVALLDRKLRDFSEPVQFIDLSNTAEIDTVGAWIVWRFADEHRARISTRNLQVTASFLVDGMVAGSWSITRKGRTATLAMEPFVRVSKADRAALTSEAERLLAFAEPDAKARDVTFGA